MPAERKNTSKLHNTVNTQLQGNWLLYARVAWFVLVALSLLVFICSLPVYIAQLNTVCTGTACSTWQLTPQALETFRIYDFSISQYVIINVILAFVQAFVWFA